MKNFVMLIFAIGILVLFAMLFNKWQERENYPAYVPPTSELTDAQKKEIEKRKDYLRRSDEGLEHAEQNQ
jgi:hypothetical protein